MIQVISAFFIAAKAHRGQRDKAGRCYFWHPIAVASCVQSKDAKVVALLHDVFEDSDLNIADLSFLSDKQKDALTRLTRSGDSHYFSYIQGIQFNDLAREVKLCDLKHNMDLSRLKQVSQADLLRTEKYRKAVEILETSKLA